MTTRIGIDPGGRTTALVAVDTTTRTALGVVLVTNKGGLLPLPADYIHAVIDDMRNMADHHEATAIHVEGVNRPNWHVGGKARGAATDPTGLLAAAQILGAVVACAPQPVTVVPPRGHGSRPLGTYPPTLVSDGERRREGWQSRVGTGQLRHARSAFDIAL